MIKLKNFNCDETWKTKIVMKLQNSNCDETQNSNFDETKSSNCDESKNSNCDETQKLKLWWNSKTQIVIKLNSNGDKPENLK